MRKSILFSVIALSIFSSCADDGLDENKCLNSVIEAYPNSTIYIDLEKPYNFYVVDSIGLILVKTMGIKQSGVTSEDRLTKIQGK